jgi:hypothetical protein
VQKCSAIIEGLRQSACKKAKKSSLYIISAVAIGNAEVLILVCNCEVELASHLYRAPPKHLVYDSELNRWLLQPKCLATFGMLLFFCLMPTNTVFHKKTPKTSL